MELREDGLYNLPWNDTDEGFQVTVLEGLPLITMVMIMQESHHFFMDTYD